MSEHDHGSIQRTARDAITSARQAHRDIHCDEEGFARHVVAALEKQEQASDKAPTALHRPDLLLAFAASHGDPRARNALELLLHQVAPQAWARFERTAPQFDTASAMERLWSRLTEGVKGRPPKLLGYHGTGPLGAWLRVAAVRLAYNMLQERGIAVGDQVLMEAVAAHDDAEADALTRKYGSLMREAVRKAVDRLDKQAGALLRLHYVEELTVEEIGMIYGCHKATAARRVDRAREALGEDIRRIFQELCPVHEGDVSSLIRAIPAYVDFSIERLLLARSGDESEAS